ncbi:MAG: ABC transporter substrate-binding protein [Beijerinckiaceae bacterium]
MQFVLRHSYILAAAAAAIYPAAASAEKLRVALPQKGLWETSITVMGEKAGIFKKAGLDLDILFTRGGSETVQAVLAGSVDVARANGLLGTIGGYSKGAPIRVTAASMTGAPDIFWYVKGDSPIKKLSDLKASDTIGFSRPGSSSHLLVLALISQNKLAAKGVPAGGLSGSFTQAMSGQLTLGWAVPPFRLKEIQEGKVRLIAKASDIDEAKNQTIRVNVSSANALKTKREALVKFHKAWVEALNYVYSSDKALEDYAAFAKVTKKEAEETRKFYPKEALEPYEIKGLELSLKQAHEYKFTSKLLAPADVKGMIDILVQK